MHFEQHSTSRSERGFDFDILQQVLDWPIYLSLKVKKLKAKVRKRKKLMSLKSGLNGIRWSTIVN